MQYIKDEIKHAIEHQDELIKMFAKEPDKKLSDRLTIMHLQYVICERDNDVITGEFFEIMRRIIIEARLYKMYNNIPDELSEIEQEIAEMDAAQKKLEKREKLLAKLSKPGIQIEPEHIQPVPKGSIGKIKTEPKADNNVQLGLF
jgi:hypothetical protein